MLCSVRSNGTARAFTDCKLYTIEKDKVDDVLSDTPEQKLELQKMAVKENLELSIVRVTVEMKPVPVFGIDK